MIGRLLRGLTSALLYFCLATIAAEAVLAAQLWVKWKMDRGTLIRMLAVAQGIDPYSLSGKGEREKDEVPAAQVSCQEILDARAAKDLNLQLREQSLANALTQMRSDDQRLAAARKHYEQQRSQYETDLAQLNEEVHVAGREQVRRVLETVKPKQAKELIVEMLDKQEMPAVVMLLREMPDSKRAKIVGEFKTPEETQRIDDVLRRIREGTPESELADNARNQLNPASDRPRKEADAGQNGKRG